jgi:Galactose oxidase, central domain
MKALLWSVLWFGCSGDEDLPVGRYSAVGGFDGERRWLHQAGGGDDDGVRDDTWRYDTVGDVWEQGNPMPQAMLRGTATAYDGDLYVFGGTLADGSAVATLYRWDLAADSWEELSGEGPSARYKPGSALVGDAIWVLGGKTDSDGGATIHSDLWSWDLLEGGWTEHTASGGPNGIYRHAMIAQGTTLWVHGGFDGAETRRGWLWSLDTETLLWTEHGSEGEDDPPERASHALVAVDDDLLVWGGNANDTRFWTYFPSADSWNSAVVEPKPLARDAFVYDADSNGDLWIIGGDPVEETGGNFVSDVWSLDLATQTWTEHRSQTGAAL